MENDIENSLPSRNIEMLKSSEFQKECIDRVEPAVLSDISDMISGRRNWRRSAVLAEVGGKVSSILATLLAYASASNLTSGVVESSLAFASGASGTIGIVLTMFAQFARKESMERTHALNIVLKQSRINAIPDVMTSLDVQPSASLS